jgi:hypothetical protein
MHLLRTKYFWRVTKNNFFFQKWQNYEKVAKLDLSKVSKKSFWKLFNRLRFESWKITGYPGIRLIVSSFWKLFNRLRFESWKITGYPEIRLIVSSLTWDKLRYWEIVLPSLIIRTTKLILTQTRFDNIFNVYTRRIWNSDQIFFKQQQMLTILWFLVTLHHHSEDS